MTFLQQHKPQQAWIFENRALLPMRQQSLWQIEAGIVRAITWLEDGTIIVLGLWGPGERLGKPIAQVDPYQIECMSEVKAIAVPLANPQQITDMLTRHLKQMQDLTIIRSYSRVETMMLKLLAWLARQFGQETQTGQLINLRLTHQDIADLLGTTRVTITRALNQLEQQGMIERLPLHRLVLKECDTWHYEI
ncbi:MAG: Regulatory protein CysR [Chroococcopsis gigantea SAG 12.99]|jgi:CRP-like cAMP-binding protein|nr:Crp/Fnr family transcriptional regulator [Chlorogloea purpurea SAG 13.99]MDV2999944.1 Regulatory protein CysR [Chroococcopsis gigantea SAG 12.99]